MEEVTYIILTISKAREVMNKIMSVFCANALVQQRSAYVSNKSLSDVEEVFLEVTNTEICSVCYLNKAIMTSQNTFLLPLFSNHSAVKREHKLFLL